MRVPTGVQPELQQAFREIWDALGPLITKDINLNGRRVINAGLSIAPKDYITRFEHDKGIDSVKNLLSTPDFQDASSTRSGIVNTTSQIFGGAKTFNSDVKVPDEAYGSAWDASLEVPTKNSVYDKIESLVIPSASVYTPTLTNTTNLDASTTHQCQYLRVGSVVHVSGLVEVDPTAAGATLLGISLPVASNIGAVTDLAGVAFSPAIAGQGAAIYGDLTNDRAAMAWIAVDVTNQTMAFVFTYRII